MPVDPLPDYLRTFRKRSGLSQRELAFLLGSKAGSKVSRYEGGRRRPSFDALLAYEVVFRVGLDALFGGLHRTVGTEIRRRAQRLSQRLDAKPYTPAIKRKIDFLNDLIHRD